MTPRVAIVGSGSGGSSRTPLCHGGLEPAEIAVFGDEPDPAGAPASARPRSASAGCARRATDTATQPPFRGSLRGEAARRLDPVPLLQTVSNCYRPSVDTFLRHIEELRARSRWDESFRAARIERVQAVDGGFDLDAHGRFRHILIAPGHPGLEPPPELAADPRVVHAYEPHEYASRVAVVGAGMAAATEWLNALAAGAEVVSVPPRARTTRAQRRPAALHQARPGRFPRAPRAERAAAARLASAFVPARAQLGRTTRARGARGPFPRRSGAERRRPGDLRDRLPGGFTHDPLLARLVAEHGLETEGQWTLADDSTVPALDGRLRTLSLTGVPAQWVFPAADTLVGMKVAAPRSFRRRIESCRTR